MMGHPPAADGLKIKQITLRFMVYFSDWHDMSEIFNSGMSCQIADRLWNDEREKNAVSGRSAVSFFQDSCFDEAGPV